MLVNLIAPHITPQLMPSTSRPLPPCAINIRTYAHTHTHAHMYMHARDTSLASHAPPVHCTAGVEQEELHLLYCGRAMLCRPGGRRHADREQDHVAQRAKGVWGSVEIARDEAWDLHLRGANNLRRLHREPRFQCPTPPQTTSSRLFAAKLADTAGIISTPAVAQTIPSSIGSVRSLSSNFHADTCTIVVHVITLF